MSWVYALGLTLVLVLGVAGAARASTVLGFDDVDVGSPYGVVPLSENYGGLVWDYGTDWTVGWQVWETDQGYFPAASAPNVVFAHSTNIGVTLPTPTVFMGAYFGGYSQVSYELSLNGSVVHTTPYASMGNNGAPAIWVASGYAGAVDRVQVMTNGSGRDWVMDDFTVTVVPEPENYLLLLPGLGLLAWKVRRLQAASVG